MKARDVMTPSPAFCTPETLLQEVARMMVDEDCGAIPVVDTAAGKPVGIVTDRDIVVRAVARGLDVRTARAADVMTGSPITVTLDAAVDDVARLAGDEQVRRLIVVDESGRCAGIIAQADLAKHVSKKDVGKMVQEVSEPVGSISR